MTSLELYALARTANEPEEVPEPLRGADAYRIEAMAARIRLSVCVQYASRRAARFWLRQAMLMQDAAVKLALIGTTSGRSQHDDHVAAYRDSTQGRDEGTHHHHRGEPAGTNRGLAA